MQNQIHFKFWKNTLKIKSLRCFNILILMIYCQVVMAQDLGTGHDALSAQKSGIWINSTCDVCWENTVNNYAIEKGWVRQAISRTWENASTFRFTGWGICTQNSQGIRIQIADSKDAPHSLLGNKLNGKANGMVLNFTFNNWGCKDKKGKQIPCVFPYNNYTKQDFIQNIAIHEFGHALGIAHEQTRSDCFFCNEKQQNDNGGDWYLTPCDVESVMNYCNPDWNGGGNLSKFDIAGIVALYGKRIILPQNTPISVNSRNPNQMDLFGVGQDGHLYSTYWNGNWHDWYQVGSSLFSQNTPISVNSRNPNQMDLFGVGQDGYVHSNWWNGDWHDLFLLGSRTFSQNTPVSINSRNPNQIDLFAIGQDGYMYSAYWNGEWHDWYRVGSGVFSQKTPLAVNSRNPNQMDVFGVGQDGYVYGTYWNGEWHDWYRLGNAKFSQITDLTIINRNSNQMDIFGVGLDGHVYSTYWNGDWHDWYQVGSGIFSQNTPITVNSRNPNQMDLFGVGQDGRVYSAYWNGDWHDWYRVGSGIFSQKTPLAVNSRNPNQMDVFGVGQDGRVYSTYWNGDWHDWYWFSDIFRNK